MTRRYTPQNPQAATMQHPQRVPLVTRFQNRSDDWTQDARLVNCYAELNEQAEAYKIQKRLGNTKAYSFTSGIADSCYAFQSSIFRQPPTGAPAILSIVGSQLYASGVAKGPVVSYGSAGNYTYTPCNSGTTALIFVQSIQNSYTYNPSTGALIQITDANFPSYLVNGAAFLDGTLYVMDFDGNIYGSRNLNDPYIYSALNVIKAQVEGDSGVAIRKHKTYVVAFKQFTTEFFFDASVGFPASPLAPILGNFLNYGCASGATIQDYLGNTVLVTDSHLGGPQVGIISNMQMNIISTPAIDKILQKQQQQYASSMIFRWAGHNFYMLSYPLGNITLVYDIGQGLWYQWSDVDGNYMPFVGAAYMPPGSGIISTGLYFQHNTDGGVYKVDTDFVYPNDNGVIFPVDIYTPTTDLMISKDKVLQAMYFKADQRSGGILNVRYSDDDYQTWTNFRSVDLGQKRPMLAKHGTFEKRAWHFRHESNTPFRISAVDLEMDLGVN